MSAPTDGVVIRETSHRARAKLQQTLGAALGPAYYYWPPGKWPASGYYIIPVDRLAEALAITGIVKAVKVNADRENLGVAWSTAHASNEGS